MPKVRSFRMRLLTKTCLADNDAMEFARRGERVPSWARAISDSRGKKGKWAPKCQ